MSAVGLAAPITGSVNFGSPVANIKIPTLDSAIFIGTPSFTVITPGSGTLGGAMGAVGTATDFTLDGPVANFLLFDGFAIDVLSFSGPNVWTITSLPNGVSLAGLGFNGIVYKSGYDPTTVVGSITAQFATGYSPTDVVAWSGNVVATAPEPGTLWFSFLGILGISSLAAARTRLRRPPPQTTVISS